MGGSENAIHLIGKEGVESWDRMNKSEVAAHLVEKIAAALSEG